MRFRNAAAIYLLLSTVAFVLTHTFTIPASADSDFKTKSVNSGSLSAGPATTRYRLDASQSKFIAHALRGGLLWFKGHDHLVAAHDFSGEAEITTDAINPASLLLVVKSESMTETNSVFTDQQK